MNELRPCRELLDPKFDGYKLSLSPVPVHKLELSQSVDCVEPSEDQYSYLHQKEFSLHNHLHSDPFYPNHVYYIDIDWNVNKFVISDITGKPEGISDVFSIPRKERTGGEFNVSLLFPSEEFVIIGDGFKTIHIVKSSSRTEFTSDWQLVHSEEIFTDSRPFHITDCCFSPTGDMLHCLVLNVELKTDEEFQQDKIENKNTSKYETVLQWITFRYFEEGDTKWKLERNEEMRGGGKVEYAALEREGDAVYIASQHKFKFPRLEKDHAENNFNSENGERVDFEWQQSFDDITIYIDGVETTQGVSVVVHEKNVTIKHCDSVLLQGTLYRLVSSELTTWKLNNNRLEVVLQKSESGTMWQKLLVDDKNGDKSYVGKEIIDPQLAEEISSRLSHLTSDTLENGSGVINDWEMEDCDAFQEESVTLYRFIPSESLPTHKLLVGGSQWLFTPRTESDCPPCMCIRSDVDGCVWKPNPPQTVDTWDVKHIATFYAFGYILASKVNRKFTVAPQDLCYVSVVDNTGHVIIYRKGVSVGGELRNRKTNKQVESIATQSMVNLQTKDNILGCIATQQYLFVLSDKHLHLIHIQ